MVSKPKDINSSFNSSHWISSGMIWTDHEFSVIANKKPSPDMNSMYLKKGAQEPEYIVSQFIKLNGRNLFG